MKTTILKIIDNLINTYKTDKTRIISLMTSLTSFLDIVIESVTNWQPGEPLNVPVTKTGNNFYDDILEGIAIFIKYAGADLKGLLPDLQDIQKYVLDIVNTTQPAAPAATEPASSKNADITTPKKSATVNVTALNNALNNLSRIDKILSQKPFPVSDINALAVHAKSAISNMQVHLANLTDANLVTQ